MAVLVRIHRALSEDDVTAVGPLMKAYPGPDQMSRLKEDALARRGSVWSSGEPNKVVAALRYVDGVRWQTLDLPQRVTDLWPSAPGAYAEALKVASDTSDPVLTDEIFAVVSGDMASSALLSTAELQPSVAAKLIAYRPQLVYKPSLWEGPASRAEPLLQVLVSEKVPVSSSKLALALVDAQAAELIAQALRLSLVSHYEVAAAIAREGVSSGTSQRYRATFGKELTEAARAAAEVNASWQMAALALLNPGRGRNAIVQRHGAEIARHLTEVDVDVAAPIATELVVGLGGTEVSQQVWQEVFPPLHRALVRQQMPDNQWRRLREVLPDGNEWDRAERLRKALYVSVKRDNWTERELADLLHRAGPEAQRLRDLAPKKSDVRKALDDAWKHISFWD
jgi:hypothetical protein